MITQKLARAVLSGLAAMLTPFAVAQADTIDVTWGGYGGIFGGSGYGYINGYIAPSPAAANPSQLANSSNFSYVAIGGDQDSYTTSASNSIFGGSGVFNVWCVDIYHWSAAFSTYTIGTINADNGSVTGLASVLGALRGSSPGGDQRVADLISLADIAYGSLATTTDSAAFQLAVWAITYGTFNSSGGITVSDNNPGFELAPSSYASLSDPRPLQLMKLTYGFRS